MNTEHTRHNMRVATGEGRAGGHSAVGLHRLGVRAARESVAVGLVDAAQQRRHGVLVLHVQRHEAQQSKVLHNLQGRSSQVRTFWCTCRDVGQAALGLQGAVLPFVWYTVSTQLHASIVNGEVLGPALTSHSAAVRRRKRGGKHVGLPGCCLPSADGSSPLQR